MSIEREAVGMLEEKLGMSEMCKKVVQALGVNAQGQYDTAAGLTPMIPNWRECGQGKQTSPIRSKLLIAEIVRAVNKLVEGYQLWGGYRIEQIWFADDGSFGVGNGVPFL